MTRIAYLGPPGTFSHEALTRSGRGEGVPVASIHDAVMAVQEGAVDRALVPIENSIEGVVSPTLDTLAVDAPDVVIVGELVHPVHVCLIAAPGVAVADVELVVSHPQPLGQCTRFLRATLPAAGRLGAASTADAVRMVAEHPAGRAALGARLAAELNGCVVLMDEVQDERENQTRFVWLAPAGAAPDAGARFKTSIVFWGAGDTVPGWLVDCLAQFADRGVNLTFIESRPRRLGLGNYMFFADVAGDATDRALAEGLRALAERTETLRVLGSYPAA